ncbi:MAG: glycosyltransferase family 2 protein [Paracoccaceae bacterium]
MLDTSKTSRQTPLIVIPCLNERQNIGVLLSWLLRVQSRVGGDVTIVDGGSSDGTYEIARSFATDHPNVHIIENPERLQSAGINLAVDQFGQTATHLIRIDAHCAYPENYCDVLLKEAQSSGAASVVVSMKATGDAPVQMAIAATQNAPVGNGGSKHRLKPVGQFVDHGHHALIDMEAFRAIGGYDPSFSHNEDAELDHRLDAAGYRIWLTERLEVSYFPRKSGHALARQYFNYGKGRARNLLKHRMAPKLRQAKVIAILPLVGLSVFAHVSMFFALPVLAWLAYCLTMALERVLVARDIKLIMVAPIAMIMHVAWSSGFWWLMVKPSPRQCTGTA